MLFSFHTDKKITDTSSLIDAMHKRYKGKWAQTITFVQHNTHYKNDSVSTSTWYEAIEYPGNFRIDVGDLKDGNGAIFAKDSLYSFKGGKLHKKFARVNNLMLLAGGINFFSKEEALKRLKNAGYNTDNFRDDTFEGRAVYVVGAARGDLKTAQFWIDKKNLYLVRTIETTPDAHVREALFRKHVKTAGGWLETEVLFLTDGKKEQLEEYKEIQVNPKLDPGIFEEMQFGKVHWRNG